MTDAMAPAPTRCWPMIVAAVRSCVGTCFRPQGRVPGLGLDCVGVVLVAAAAAGVGRLAAPPYALAGDNAALLDRELVNAGCVPVAVPLSGDIVVLAPRGDRRHLGVITPSGMVHAHAGLARVVEGPIDPGWSIVAAWRLPGAR